MSFDEFDKLLDQEIGTDKAKGADNVPVIILVIDDDSRVLDDLEFALRKKYKVRLCSSGEEGLAAISPDVHAVILDIKMKDKDGFWTFKELKKHFIHLPIIFHTAYQDIKDPFDIMNEFRPFGYISKGDDFMRLQTSIESAVDYYAKILENKTLYQDLQKAHTALLKLDEMKTKFINMATHELRTPLAVIYGYLNIIETFGGQLNPEEFQHMAENFRKGLDKLKTIVNNISDLSRLTSPQVPIQKKPTPVNDLINSVIKEIEPFIEYRKQTLIVKIPDKDVTVNVDRDLIWHTIINLLLNAIRYTQDAGKIVVEVVDTDEKFAKVIVSDTGIGIPENEFENIFKSFYEVGDVMKHSSGTIEFRSKGIGVGLTIAKMAVELHGGKIWLTSELNKGSVFYFTIPKI